jgi:hypothetical protein
VYPFLRKAASSVSLQVITRVTFKFVAFKKTELVPTDIAYSEFRWYNSFVGAG